MICFFHVNLDRSMFLKLKYIIAMYTAIFLTFSGVSFAQGTAQTNPTNTGNFQGILDTGNPNDPLNILIERENANRLQKRLEEERMKAYERQLVREAEKDLHNPEGVPENLTSEKSEDKSQISPPK